MDIYTKLARQTIQQYLTQKKLPETKNLNQKLLTKSHGCFVSIHLKNGELRGCIGTITATYKNLGSEIIANALEAAFHDPRFLPLSKEEIKQVKLSVDILSAPEEIYSKKELDPKKYGVIVKSSHNRLGLLLPNIEGIENIDQQIEIASQKAGISSQEEIQLYRFTTERHAERQGE